MNSISHDSLAKLILRTEYSGDGSSHIDHYYCNQVNIWRDFFQPDHLELLLGVREGSDRQLIDRGCITYDPSWLLELQPNQWRPPHTTPGSVVPRVGRWYPQGFLSDVSSVYPQTLQPMRVLTASDEALRVDCNHPLADIDISVAIHVESVMNQVKERGGRCTAWLEEALADGPGMQIVRDDVRIDHNDPDRLIRTDSELDCKFYQSPRMVDHVDNQAKAHLNNYTSQLFSDSKVRVLDLMSSMESHLPRGPVVEGLGMNSEEMKVNKRLANHLVHDLNESPLLPFKTESFDAVCCHLSFEYLLYPQLVMAEVARILAPGGLCLVSFSDRWFPEKVTALWQRLHEFERMGFVLETMRDEFVDLVTVSYRNWPRPQDDPHYHIADTSDPLYIVHGRKQEDLSASSSR